MKRTGLNFYVEGEFARDRNWQGCDDPANEDWEFFSNQDIHPFSKPYFTAWSQFSEVKEKDKAELVEQIVAVIDWLQEELDWRGFDASLWLWRGENKPERVFRWELC